MYSKFQDSPNTKWKLLPKSGNNYKNIHLTFMGRDAIALLLKSIKPKYFKVILPAYTCNEVIDQFIEHGFKIVYYDTNHFKIDHSEILNLVKKEQFDIFYFIRYFGIQPFEIDKIISSIKEHNHDILIIEDRAHYLSDKPLNSNIDAYIYSFRKLLPIPEGGGLQTDIRLKYSYKSKLVSNILALLMVVKKRFIGHNPAFSRSNISPKSVKKHDYNNTKNIKIMPPSYMSEQIIRSYNLQESINFRRELFYAWLDGVNKIENITPLYSKLDKDDIPQGFPIIVNDATHLHQKMLDEGIYLKRHWQLDSSFSNIAPKAYNLSNRLITLPIYEDILESDIDLILKRVAKYV